MSTNADIFHVGPSQPKIISLPTKFVGFSEGMRGVFGVCMSYTKCKPHNTMIQASYSWIYHGEQSACHLVYYPRG